MLEHNQIATTTLLRKVNVKKGGTVLVLQYLRNDE
jgi:hypothetical protein